MSLQVAPTGPHRSGWRPHTGPSPAILMSAGFLTLAGNYHLFQATSAVFTPIETSTPFLLSPLLVLFCTHALLLGLLSNRFIFKPLATLLMLIAVPVSYFSDRFGTIIDDAMILNLLQTDCAEAIALLTPECAR